MSVPSRDSADDHSPRSAALRVLPQVQKLLERPEALALAAEYGRSAVTVVVRGRLCEMREVLLAGAAAPAEFSADFSYEALFADIRKRLEAGRAGPLRRVINATGIVLHTNLGRAPLAPEAMAAVADVAAGYANLEMDLETGGRGSRYDAVAGLLCELTGAEAALAVNNNAAAVLLALSAMAAGGEAVVSRGELVEIGGGFRIPDVVRQGGARLIEVGATNKTRLSDYEAAVGPDTRLFLKVHRSNFRIVGFTSAPDLPDLVALAHRHGLPVVEDLGSGMLADLRPFGLPHEPTVRDSVAAGVDLVTFSGDKLLGGPQAGIIVGRRNLIARLKAHPLLRALRIDKLNLAALEATLRLYREPERLAERLPVLSMLGQTAGTLVARADRLAALLAEVPGLEVRPDDGVAFAGGGSLPDVGMPTRILAVRAEGLSEEKLAGRLILDMRTVADRDLPDIAEAFRSALS